MSEPLPLHQLATLVAIVNEGGFDAAARALHISAPAVSQRLKALEKAVGLSLVSRGAPPVPTAAGERLLPHARRLVTLAEDAAAAVGLDAARENTPVLHLAVNADSLDTWFVDALGAAPGRDRTQVRVHRADQDHTASLLVTGHVAGAVTAQATAAPGCVAQRLGVMRYLPVVHPRLLGADGPDLASLPVVEFDEADELQRASLRSWLGYLPTPPRHLVPSSAAFARAIEAGLGWGMLPEAQAAPGLARSTLVPLGAGAPHDVVLYWQRWEDASAALLEFSEHVLRYGAARLRVAGDGGGASPAGA